MVEQCRQTLRKDRPQECAQCPSFPGCEILAGPLPRSSPLEVIRILQPGGLCKAVTSEGRRRRRRQLPAAISHLEAESRVSTDWPGDMHGCQHGQAQGTHWKENSYCPTCPGQETAPRVPYGSTVLPEPPPPCCPGCLCPKPLDQQPMRGTAPTPRCCA